MAPSSAPAPASVPCPPARPSTRSRLRSARAACCCAALLTLLLAGCSTPRSFSPTAVPNSQAQRLGLAPGPDDSTPLPPGWWRVLDGERFTDEIGSPGFAVSAARPGRVAACALPSQLLYGIPTFLLSDDNGHTWQPHPLPTKEPAHGCMVLADPQQPNTFVVEYNSHNSQPLITTDAGRTWGVITPPDGALSVGISALVAGHLFGGVDKGSGPRQFYYSERDPDGTWHAIDTPLPLVADHTAINAIAVDPANPQRIYAALFITLPQAGNSMGLYTTSDDGASWSLVLPLPAIHQTALWTASGGRVYAENTIGGFSDDHFHYSADQGAHWTHSPVEILSNGSFAETVNAVSATGLVVVQGVAAYSTLDPVTGVQTQLAPLPRPSSAPTCVITEGAHPALICSSDTGAYGYALPPR